MRLWLSLASIIVTGLSEQHVPLQRCPEDSVCLIFTHIKNPCTVNGVPDESRRGYIWGPNTQCVEPNYGYVKFQLNIRPITPFKWKFVAIMYYSSNEPQPDLTILADNTFNVGYAEIKILSRDWMEFKTDLNGLGRSTFFRVFDMGHFRTHKTGHDYDYYHVQYEFEIETEDELINYFGPKVEFYVAHGNWKEEMFNQDFPELLMEKAAISHRKLEGCPCTRSCVVFMQNNPCAARDESQELEGKGYVWKSNLDCGRPTYESLHSRIEFKPITATKYYVTTTILDEGKGIRDLGFDFGETAGLTFTDESHASFTYTREGKQVTSPCNVRHEESFTSKFNKTSYKFKKYSLQMESDGLNMDDIVNSYVNFKKSGKSMTLNDDAFHEQLKQLKTPAEHRKIEPCSDGKACLVFVEFDACSSNGEFPPLVDSGFVWTKNSTCNRPTYEVLLSRLDFEPISTTKWKAVIIVFHEPGKSRYGRDWQIRNIDFNFGNASISVPSTRNISFGWTNREGKVTSSIRPMHHDTDEDTITSEDAKTIEDGKPLTFKRYHFNIEAGGEELHQFFGPEIEFKLKGQTPMALALNGTEFTKELGQISHKDSGLSTLEIVLIVLGILLLLIIIIAIVIGVCWYCCTKSKRRLHNADARNTYRPVPSNPPIRANAPPSSNSSKSSEAESQYFPCSENPQ